MKKVAVIMGSASDLPVVEKAIETLDSYGIPYEVHVYSAHRTPVEANTTLPVIGIPVKSSTLDGLDALLSTVQMPAGIPVATVAIDGAANAAHLAAQIIAVDDKALAEKINEVRKKATEGVLQKNDEIAAKYNK